MNNKTIPDAPCKLIGKPTYPQKETTGCTMQWMVLSCPHCGKKHYHGAGNNPEESDSYLGHRVAHCLNADIDNPGYNLVKADSEV